MQVDPALDGLLDLLAEATVRKLETRNPAGLAGFRNDVPLANEDWNNERIHNGRRSPQAPIS